ncbi:hypothetical protein [Leptolyngbya sp. NIES-2104]|uniref:hypothetical protein n=1 Tax=Leptolyngbya sp. NIES-2104 TaxID=1552121 RepID=UPI0006EC8AAC|nr:hypothetical protein [Leptolyngbya sp. NIES-2104]GAP99961.1 hypothetical protein NIES2104_65270 [Leptolyngbya sp. NIES-2104]
MLNRLKQTVVVQPGGLIQVQSPDLPVGMTVEVIILIQPSPQSAEVPLAASRSQFQHRRDQIIAAGIPLLTDEQIEQEVAERRGGYREDAR